MIRFLLLLLVLAWVPVTSHAENGFVARKLVAFYDGRYELNIRSNTIHRFLGLPANRLGYEIEYHDINEPLPELGRDVHGILVWFHHEPIPRVAEYIAWLERQMRAGKHLVVMESLGVGRQEALDETSLTKLRNIYERLGMRDKNIWHALTYKAEIAARNPQVVDFERMLRPPLAPFAQTVATGAGISHMRIAVSKDAPGEYADVVITGPQGGFAAGGYVYHEQEVNEHTVSAWYVNPFNFLKLALDPPLFPVPDVTTRNGRRIFYSHIDGDGWNNRTHIEGYDHVFSSKVILEEILKPYSDFGFSLGLVAGSVAENCFGSELSRQIAIDALALPNVEATSHTYTHPLYWQFFEDWTVEKERPFAPSFPKKPGLFAQDYQALLGSLRPHNHDGAAPPSVTAMKESRLIKDAEAAQMRELLDMHDVPRSFNCVPFDEENEIQGANAVIESLAPPGTKIKLLQWSGNTSPYERFLRKTREAGMLNINGGESRYDAEYPSYSTLYPIGIRLGDELQIYSTASNENTYTNLWSERFFGYRYLIDTVRHTETPIRLAPFNVYFHSYSGERPGSLRALQEIMHYARSHELIPVLTSTFAAIANGFYTTRVEQLGDDHWRIHDRGTLQTLRFPAPQQKRVDMARSTGVLGQRIFQENLYIFLNPSVDRPELYLIEQAPQTPTQAMQLLSSRWDVLEAERPSSTSVQLTLQGYGEGEMEWEVPQDGDYEITIQRSEEEAYSFFIPSKNRILHFNLGQVRAFSPVALRISHNKTAR